MLVLGLPNCICTYCICRVGFFCSEISTVHMFTAHSQTQLEEICMTEIDTGQSTVDFHRRKL
jgi:hypothetical protein